MYVTPSRTRTRSHTRIWSRIIFTPPTSASGVLASPGERAYRACMRVRLKCTHQMCTHTHTHIHTAYTRRLILIRIYSISSPPSHPQLPASSWRRLVTHTRSQQEPPKPRTPIVGKSFPSFFAPVRACVQNGRRSRASHGGHGRLRRRRCGPRDEDHTADGRANVVWMDWRWVWVGD